MEQILIQQAQNLMKNKIVMNFLREEALKKVAAEMQSKGYSSTYKAVELLSYRYPNIAKRVDEYVSIGVIACLHIQAEKAK